MAKANKKKRARREKKFKIRSCVYAKSALTGKELVRRFLECEETVKMVNLLANYRGARAASVKELIQYWVALDKARSKVVTVSIEYRVATGTYKVRLLEKAGGKGRRLNLLHSAPLCFLAIGFVQWKAEALIDTKAKINLVTKELADKIVAKGYPITPADLRKTLQGVNKGSSLFLSVIKNYPLTFGNGRVAKQHLYIVEETGFSAILNNPFL
jgi:hypothetical protein